MMMTATNAIASEEVGAIVIEVTLTITGNGTTTTGSDTTGIISSTASVMAIAGSGAGTMETSTEIVAGTAEIGTNTASADRGEVSDLLSVAFQDSCRADSWAAVKDALGFGALQLQHSLSRMS